MEADVSELMSPLENYKKQQPTYWFGCLNWKIVINLDKSQALLVQKKEERHSHIVVDKPVPWIRKLKYLGVAIDEKVNSHHSRRHSDESS